MSGGAPDGAAAAAEAREQGPAGDEGRAAPAGGGAAAGGLVAALEKVAAGATSSSALRPRQALPARHTARPPAAVDGGPGGRPAAGRAAPRRVLGHAEEAQAAAGTREAEATAAARAQQQAQRRAELLARAPLLVDAGNAAAAAVADAALPADGRAQADAARATGSTALSEAVTRLSAVRPTSQQPHGAQPRGPGAAAGDARAPGFGAADGAAVEDAAMELLQQRLQQRARRGQRPPQAVHLEAPAQPAEAAAQRQACMQLQQQAELLAELRRTAEGTQGAAAGPGGAEAVAAEGSARPLDDLLQQWSSHAAAEPAAAARGRAGPGSGSAGGEPPAAEEAGAAPTAAGRSRACMQLQRRPESVVTGHIKSLQQAVGQARQLQPRQQPSHDAPTGAAVDQLLASMLSGEAEKAAPPATPQASQQQRRRRQQQQQQQRAERLGADAGARPATQLHTAGSKLSDPLLQRLAAVVHAAAAGGQQPGQTPKTGDASSSVAAAPSLQTVMEQLQAARQPAGTSILQQIMRGQQGGDPPAGAASASRGQRHKDPQGSSQREPQGGHRAPQPQPAPAARPKAAGPPPGGDSLMRATMDRLHAQVHLLDGASKKARSRLAEAQREAAQGTASSSEDEGAGSGRGGRSRKPGAHAAPQPEPRASAKAKGKAAAASPAATAASRWAGKLRDLRAAGAPTPAAAAAAAGTEAQDEQPVAGDAGARQADDLLQVTLPAGCSVRQLSELLGGDLEAVEAALAELGDAVHSGRRLLGWCRARMPHPARSCGPVHGAPAACQAPGHHPHIRAHPPPAPCRGSQRRTPSTRSRRNSSPSTTTCCSCAPPAAAAAARWRPAPGRPPGRASQGRRS
jgi:hypothetical protein